MYHAPLAFQCINVGSDEGGEDGNGKEEIMWRLPGLCYADDLVLSEEDLRAIVGRFVEMRRRRGLKVNASKSKIMVLNGEEGL